MLGAGCRLCFAHTGTGLVGGTRAGRSSHGGEVNTPARPSSTGVTAILQNLCSLDNRSPSLEDQDAGMMDSVEAGG
jgi:hypothetical protein